MKTSLRFVALLVAVFGFATASHAAPITYTFSGIASGHLGSSAFTDALVLVTATADTEDVIFQSLDFGDGTSGTVYGNAIGLTTVNIAGLGTVTVLDPTGIFAFPPIPPELLEEGEELFLIPAIVIGTLDEPPSLLDGFTGLAGVAGDPALGYNLATSIGPILGAGGVAHPTELSLNTSGGSLSFLNSIGPDTEGTFTAITATTSVPEPTSLSLLASGILSLTGLSRFRKRA